MMNKAGNISNYLMMFLVLTGVGYMYDKYKRKYQGDDELSQYHLVKKFLLNEDPTIGNVSGKPTLWIHSEYENNAKNWLSFNSRSTNNLNKKYVNFY